MARDTHDVASDYWYFVLKRLMMSKLKTCAIYFFSSAFTLICLNRNLQILSLFFFTASVCWVVSWMPWIIYRCLDMLKWFDSVDAFFFSSQLCFCMFFFWLANDDTIWGLMGLGYWLDSFAIFWTLGHAFGFTGLAGVMVFRPYGMIVLKMVMVAGLVVLCRLMV